MFIWKGSFGRDVINLLGQDKDPTNCGFVKKQLTAVFPDSYLSPSTKLVQWQQFNSMAQY